MEEILLKNCTFLTMDESNPRFFGWIWMKNGKIVSMARKVRETDLLCGISHVFTRREYRGKGFARQTVTALTEDILKQGKLAYLYVDRTNPISNHLYQSIGYEYGKPHIETAYLPAENA